MSDECGCCEEERRTKSRASRKLVTLPMAIIDTDTFRKRDVSLKLCEYCDGDALPAALEAHEKRSRP